MTIKEMAVNTKKKDQILKRIAEHNLKNDTTKNNFYNDKTDRQAGDVVELSAIFCDNFIISGLTTTSRTKGKECADFKTYADSVRQWLEQREIVAEPQKAVKPVGQETPSDDDYHYFINDKTYFRTILYDIINPPINR